MLGKFIKNASLMCSQVQDILHGFASETKKTSILKRPGSEDAQAMQAAKKQKRVVFGNVETQTIPAREAGVGCSVTFRESLFQPIFDLAMDQMNAWFDSTTQNSEDDAQEYTKENAHLTQGYEQEKEIPEEEVINPTSSHEEY